MNALLVDQAMLQLLASSDADWVTRSTKGLWNDFASLQVQLRRLAEQPELQIVDSVPILYRRDFLFDIDQINKFRLGEAF